MKDIIISVENLDYSIPTGESVLKGISFTASRGEFIGILGRNGVGKTTLIDLLMGFRDHVVGKITVFDQPPVSNDRKNYKRVAFLSQEVFLKGNLSIGKFLKFHADFQESYCLEEEKRLLRYFQLDCNTKIGALSTGQQKKVQIIANLASMPELILIDEITAVLDPETRMQFFELIKEYKEKHNACIVLATNIAEDLTARADKILFISDEHGSIHRPCEISMLFNMEEVE
ncbi:MAG: ABC transporter ATP-binding protein [Bacteriovoracaceae bacterium]|nr:ABC transporter ATP-binding protein [Bacteriovoracaceae bacterium]